MQAILAILYGYINVTFIKMLEADWIINIIEEDHTSLLLDLWNK